MTEPDIRDALHARVRRICGNAHVIKCLILSNFALVEFPKSVALVFMSGRKIKTLRMKNASAATLARHLAAIYEVG